MKSAHAPLIGAVAGLFVAGAALLDQTGGRWTARDVAAHYGPFGAHPNPDVLTVLLIVAGGGFAAWMGGAALLTRRGHPVAAAVGVGAAVLGWGALAVLGAAACEFGGPVLLGGWRAALCALPLVAIGVVTAELLSEPHPASTA